MLMLHGSHPGNTPGAGFILHAVQAEGKQRFGGVTCESHM
jgi:hypothetical protein